MFDIVFSLLEELFNWLPTIALFCILAELIGGMVFKG